MLDPLSALSLAANIAQFTDFGIRLVKEIKRLNSHDTGYSSNLHYQNIASDLADNISRVQRAMLVPAGSPPSSKAEIAKLKRLAQDCTNAATELSNVLKKLERSENTSKFDNFRLALNNVWSQGRIEEMTEKLLQVKEEAELEFLLVVSEKLDALLQQHTAHEEGFDDTTNKFFETLRNNQKSTADLLVGNVDAIVQLHRFVENALRSNVEDAKEEIISAVRMLEWATSSTNWDTSGMYDASLPRIRQSIRADALKKEALRDRIRNSLMFQSMSERHEDIVEAHKRTFEWVYDRPSKDDSWSSFSEWLELGSGIYWMRGKPGSGKSCLMKYLFDERRTQELLNAWSNGLPIVKAGFFFWYAGTEMQKSHSGLLRSILWQILDQQPKLIPIAYPKQWKYLSSKVRIEQPIMNGKQAIADAIRRTTTQTTYPLKVCLFIDGLDEFSGENAEVIELFNTIAAASSIKICISSRPWPVFTEAFASCPGLTLQDLTRNDIQEYVQTQLQESTSMKRLQVAEPRDALLLIEEIVEKSSGVFLWVRLVVPSLLSGLTNNDHIADLRERTKQLPEELDELYIYILKRIDPFYLREALPLIAMVQHARRPLSSLAISIADEADYDGFLNCRPKRFTEGEFTSRCQMIEEKIQSRCLGLLECNIRTLDPSFVSHEASLERMLLYCGYARPIRRVQFMHRTIKDFFDKPDVDEKFRAPSGGKLFEFDIHGVLSLAYLVLFKRIFTMSLYGSWPSAHPTFWMLIKECWYHAAEVERTMKTALTSIHDDVETTAIYHYSKVSESNWSQSWVLTHSFLDAQPQTYSDRALFLALSIEFNLGLYVIEKIERRQQQCPPLLQEEADFLLTVVMRRTMPNRRLCSVLLASGADPNQRDLSIWQEFLATCNHRFSSDHNERCENDDAILELFIRHGANLEAVCQIESTTGINISTPASVVLLKRGNPRHLSMILDCGVDPTKQLLNNLTLWQEALQCVYQELLPVLESGRHRPKIFPWIEILQLLLEYGASPLQVATISQDVGRKQQLKAISVLTVVREVFSKWEPEQAANLEAKLPANLAADIRISNLAAGGSNSGSLSPLRLINTLRPFSWSSLTSLSPTSPNSTGTGGNADVCDFLSPATKVTKRRSLSRMFSKIIP